jgi:2-oxoglutarate dehydrogenase E2 component (dihydrolipoamide succinyltransferase)
VPQSIDIITPPDQEGTEAVVLRWFKRIGDTVTQHEPLLELETDKVTVEIPSPASGQLLEILKVEKDAVEPGTVLGRIGSGAAAVETRAAPAAAPRPAARANVESALLSPAVRRMLAEHNLDPSQIAGTGKDGRITAQDVTRHLEQLAAPAREAPRTATPSDTARRPAVTQPAPAALRSETPPPYVARTAPGASRHVPHTQMRKRIAT